MVGVCWYMTNVLGLYSHYLLFTETQEYKTYQRAETIFGIGRGGIFIVYQTHEQLHEQGRPDQPDLQWWCTRNQATDPGILTIKDTDAKQKAWLTRRPAGWFLRESTILPVSYSSMAVKPRWWTCTMVRDVIVGKSWLPTAASGCHINEKDTAVMTNKSSDAIG